MSQGLIASLLPNVNTILGVRDSIGAVKLPVNFVTRTWYTDTTYAAQSTDIMGFAKDVVVQMFPSPNVIEFKQDLKLKSGGMVKAGDILLKAISLSSFTMDQLDGTSPASNIEKLFKVGSKMYQVVQLTQDYLTWNLMLREMTNQTIYP
jgi:hypothetical protein